MRQWALEGNPCTGWPSFPAYATREEADVQANAPHMTARGHTPPRILTRATATAPWTVATEDGE